MFGRADALGAVLEDGEDGQSAMRVIGIIDLLRQERVERFAINVDADDLAKR